MWKTSEVPCEAKSKQQLWRYIWFIAVYGLFFCGIWVVVGKVKSDQQIHIYALHRLLESRKRTMYTIIRRISTSANI